MELNEQHLLRNYYFEKHILITGASGYIAHNLIKCLMSFDCTIVCFSRNIKKIKKQEGTATLILLEANYQEFDAFQNAVEGIDVIFHLAAQTSIYTAEERPYDDYNANVEPMRLLLDACKMTDCKPIIVFSGTSTQCGIPKMLPVDENVIDNPITVYDFHKLQAENWIKFYTNQGWVQGTSMRLTNVYGPGPISSSPDRGILNLMIKKALNGERLVIYGEGDYIRDYIFINDVVETFLVIPIYINSMIGRHFILGSGLGVTISDAIKLVGKIVSKETNLKIEIDRVEMPSIMGKIESRNFTADLRSLRNLGLCRKMCDLDHGIQKTVKFYN